MFVNVAKLLTLLPTSVPLCYVYPAMLHYKACAQTRKQKIADLALMIFGFVPILITSGRRTSQVHRGYVNGAPGMLVSYRSYC